MYKCYTKSEHATVALAKKLARGLKGGDILLLQGELGSGKTTFVQGLAQALGVRERITSPTFVLMHIHGNMKTRKQGNIKNFIHADAYRVKSARAFEDIGLTDWLGRPDTITVVEWGEKIKPLLKGKRYMVIKFEHGKRPSERLIQLQRKPPLLS